MTLGSPINSPGNPGNQSQYLPPFLMGDPQAMTPHNNTLSPKLGRYNVSFGKCQSLYMVYRILYNNLHPAAATSPIGYPSQEPVHSNQQLNLNRSGLGTRVLFAGVNNANASSNTSATAGNGTNTSHQAGPPTQGLFDSLRGEETSAATPHRTHLGILQGPNLNSTNYSLNQSCHPPTTQLNDSYVANASHASMRPLCSPLGANMSQLTMPPMSPQANDADFWVTIFGFSPGVSSMILQHFTMCGTIVDVVHAPQNGNWMHVRFASRIECDKALNYNLKVIANNVMVGVTRCTDESIIKNHSKGPEVDTDTLKPRVRPLAQQSYNVAQNDIHVSPSVNAPQQNSGLMNKAMDLLFGW